MGDRQYVYDGEAFSDIDISPVTYEPEFFPLQIELESCAFFELRKRNGILPYKLSDASDAELQEIRAFFDSHRDTFFFLFSGSELIGSVLLVGKYMQCLAVASKWQKKGYGTQLAKYAVRYAFDHGCKSVELDVMEGNDAAARMYEKMGFRKVNS